MDTLLKSGTFQRVTFCGNGWLRGLGCWFQAHGNIELMQTTICKQDGPQWPRGCLVMNYCLIVETQGCLEVLQAATSLVICTENAT